MSDFDHFDLDGHSLRLLVAVVEEGAVTRAAWRLGVTQSAVSHGLDKLRAIVGDPLFVRSGRGIVPTARALALVASCVDRWSCASRVRRERAISACAAASGSSPGEFTRRPDASWRCSLSCAVWRDSIPDKAVCDVPAVVTRMM